jgi:hypothetical protein
MLPPILQAIERLGFKAFDGGHAFNLNLIGIRARQRDQALDLFDDWMTCTYRTERNGRWVTKYWPCTTDPGKQALLNPELYNVEGTAIMARGQHRSAYTIGLHQNRYEALVNRGPGAKPVSFYRDANRDTVLEFDPAKLETGTFAGLNIHKAGRDSARISGINSSAAAWSWSAGCQVLKRERDFHELMDLAHLQVETNPAWDTFTYTLINEEDLWT